MPSSDLPKLLRTSVKPVHKCYLCTGFTEVLNNSGTLYNAILRIPRNFLETRENIKIWIHPFYHINLGWFSLEWSKKKYFFSKKKFKMADSKKSSFFKIANSQKIFAKILQIGPWVSRIDWCNSTYMVVRLSDIRAKTA